MELSNKKLAIVIILLVAVAIYLLFAGGVSFGGAGFQAPSGLPSFGG